MDFSGLGDALRAHREARDLSQEEVAETGGVALGTVNKIETSKRLPDLRTLGSILDGIGIRLSDLARTLEGGGVGAHDVLAGRPGGRPTHRTVRAAFPLATDELIEKYLRVWNEAQGVNAALEHVEEQLEFSKAG